MCTQSDEAAIRPVGFLTSSRAHCLHLQFQREWRANHNQQMLVLCGPAIFASYTRHMCCSAYRWAQPSTSNSMSTPATPAERLRMAQSRQDCESSTCRTWTGTRNASMISFASLWSASLCQRSSGKALPSTKPAAHGMHCIYCHAASATPCLCRAVSCLRVRICIPFN